MEQTQGAMVLRHIRQLVASQSHGQQSDLQLLQRFIADREEAAFTTLVRRHGPMVLGVSRGVLHHQQDAEDVFQATFLVLARKADTIRKHEAVSSWLHGVAYRLALKAKTRTDRRRRREEPTRDAEASPADDLTMRELRTILHEELHRLPEKYRASLLLCYWEGKTRDEAAERLGVTAGAFKKYLARARELLGSRLARRGLAPSAALFATLFAESGAHAAISSVTTLSTARAAVAFAMGNGASTGASGAAAVLAEGVLRTMTITKYVKLLLSLLLVSGLGAGASLATYAAFTEQQTELGIAAPIFQHAPPGERSDKDRIVGTWRFAKAVANGQDLPVEFTTVARMTFTKDGKLVMKVLDQAKEGAYKLVGAGKIDMSPNSDKDLGPAIFKFDGDDRLTVCASNQGTNKPRPTEFAAEKGSGLVLFVLQRAKPGDDKLTPEQKGAIDKVREAANRAISVNNLKQIGLAFHNYHDQGKAFPAHAIYSKDGKTPLLSWRVAILPYIEQDGLYKQFKLDEPWDSDHNKKLIARMPAIYELPGAKKEPGMTYYQVITGDGTLFVGTKQMTLADITDGTSNTLLATEGKVPVTWTRPDDLQMPKDKDKVPAIGGHFQNGTNVLMCDGAVRFVPRTIAPAKLRALITPSGGEVAD